MTLKMNTTTLTPENKKLVYADRAHSRRRRIQKARRTKNKNLNTIEDDHEDVFWSTVTDEDAARCHVCGCSPCSLDMPIDFSDDGYLF